jgi:N-acyl-phosphatidylethanolamine-hydrolysing phospholipase D
LSKPRKFFNPWPNAELERPGSALLRWQWERMRNGRPDAPPPGTFPTVASDIAHPHAHADEVRITWLGHASFLLQIDELNVLLDPHLSKRASPFQSFGPARLVDAPLAATELPRIDVVILSHDHYDHLDEPTVQAVHEHFGAGVTWITPQAYTDWFAQRGVHNLIELDWWAQTTVGGLRVTATPAQHWTRRGWRSMQRQWASFMIEGKKTSVYFAGDSGYCPAFKEIGERFGSCDVALIPIGAYEPRWFMKAAHMNPEEAVQVYREVRARTFIPMHWGTFRLTDEDMREPPIRLRAAWHAAGLPESQLAILRHGETFVMEK